MVKLYCKKINREEKDRILDCSNHEELDDLPRKSVGQQVEAFLLAGQNLEMSRRAFFELEDIDDNVDIDEYDTGIDEYSDLHDFSEVQKDLSAKFKEVYNLRKEHAKYKKATVQEKETVESADKQPATAT